MSSVVIGFSRPKPLWMKPGAIAIMAWQGGTPYSHVYIKVYDAYTKETLVYQASQGMVNCMNYDNFSPNETIVAEFTEVIPDLDFKATIKLSQELLGRPYGYLGLAKLVLARGLRSVGLVESWSSTMSTFFCSQFISTLFPRLAIATQRPSDDIQPSDLYSALKSGITINPPIGD